MTQKGGKWPTGMVSKKELLPSPRLIRSFLFILKGERNGVYEPRAVPNTNAPVQPDERLAERRLRRGARTELAGRTRSPPIS